MAATGPMSAARDDPGRDVGALVDRLTEVNGRAIELTEALLRLSRADRSLSWFELVDLSLLAEEAAETLLPVAERRGVTLHVVGEPARVSGNGPLLQQLIANLVHNAIVHNVPDGGVVVHTRTARAGVEVLVENTGEVMDQRRVDTLAEPFLRGAERARDADHVGS